jgi:hypothetical protein
MDWMCVYGHNIYIDDGLVGYISDDQDGEAILFISGKKFATMDPEGIIYMGNDVDEVEVGYIDDGGDVYFHKKHVGEVDSTNDIRFNGDELKVS